MTIERQVSNPSNVSRALKAFFLEPALPVGISFAGQLKLMDMTFSRLRFGINAIPFVAVPLVWLYSQNHTDSTALVIWGLGYAAAAAWINRCYRIFSQRNAVEGFDEVWVLRWRPRLNAIAVVHGFGLSTAVLISAQQPNFEFGLLLYATLAAIVAGNATHQTPVLGIFWRFYNASWNVSILFVYWVFPDHWRFVLPLTFIFSLAIYRNAFLAHQFFVKQIVLEERAASLATQFKAAKDDAEQALESKNLFLSTASHDLRQPVFAIGMLTEAIASQSSEANIAPLLVNLRSSVRSLNFMFNSLLDLSRIESGHTSAVRVPLNLELLLREVVAIFEPTARVAGLQLRQRLPKQPIAVCGDPDLLRQALVNLTHNAMRYTKRGGVLIGVRRRGVQWQIEVWDTGIGVADSEHEKIYSPYYRSEHAWGADATGHGLGLHVVARCAKLMGAQYGLTSRLGRGSRFWLRLDQTALQAVPAPGSKDNVEVLPHERLQGRCLVVEDDPQVTDAWAALLGAWQLQARFATNASEAAAVIQSGFEPGVIFCDLRLRSGESGFDILRDLLDAVPTARGAMVSGEYASPQLAQAEDEGYVVIRKPLNIDQLYALLSRWLAT